MMLPSISDEEIKKLISWNNYCIEYNLYPQITTVINKLIDFYNTKIENDKFLKITTNLLVRKENVIEIRKFDEDNEFFIIVTYVNGADTITFKTKDEMEKAFKDFQILLK